MLTLKEINALAVDMECAERRAHSLTYLRDRLAKLREAGAPLTDTLANHYLDADMRRELAAVVNEAAPDLIRLAELRIEAEIAKNQRDACAKRLQLGTVVSLSEVA